LEEFDQDKHILSYPRLSCASGKHGYARVIVQCFFPSKELAPSIVESFALPVLTKSVLIYFNYLELDICIPSPSISDIFIIQIKPKHSCLFSDKKETVNQVVIQKNSNNLRGGYFLCLYTCSCRDNWRQYERYWGSLVLYYLLPNINTRDTDWDSSSNMSDIWCGKCLHWGNSKNDASLVQFGNS